MRMGSEMRHGPIVNRAHVHAELQFGMCCTKKASRGVHYRMPSSGEILPLRVLPRPVIRKPSQRTGSDE